MRVVFSLGVVGLGAKKLRLEPQARNEITSHIFARPDETSCETRMIYSDILLDNKLLGALGWT